MGQKILRLGVRIFFFLMGAGLSSQPSLKKKERVLSARVFLSEILSSSKELFFLSQDKSLSDLQFHLGVFSYLPDITFSYSDNLRKFSDAQNAFDKQFTFGIEQPFFSSKILLDILYRKKERRLDLELYSRERTKATSESLFNGISLYLSFPYLKKKRLTISESLSLIQKEYETLKLKKERGFSSELDLVEAEIKLLEAEARWNDLMREEQDLWSQIVSVNPSFLLEDSIENISISETVNEHFLGFQDIITEEKKEFLLQKMIENNFDLFSGEAQWNKNLFQKNASFFEFIPKISVFFDYNLSNTEFPLNKNEFGLGLRFDLNTPLVPLSLSMSTNENFDQKTDTSLSISKTSGWNEGWFVSKKEKEVNSAKLRRELEEKKKQVIAQSKISLEKIFSDRKRLYTLRRQRDVSAKKIQLLRAQMNRSAVAPLEYFKSIVENLDFELSFTQTLYELFKQELNVIEQSRIEDFFDVYSHIFL